jgi:O-antigen/teichoic acid export membrane protein
MMDRDVKDQIVKNSFWNVAGSIISRVGGFILVIFLSRLLMPEGFGKYSLAMTLSLFFITFSDLGINQTLIRYVSLNLDKKTNESASYFNYLFKIKLIVTFILSIILFFISYPLSYFIFKDPSLFLPFLLLSFYVLFMSLTGFLESLFFIKKNVKYISIKESLFILAKLAALLILTYFISSEFNLIGVFISFAIISALIFFFVLYLSKHSYSSLFKKTEEPKDKKGLLKFIFLLGIQNISVMIISMASVILLGVFLAEKYIGYYSASWALISSLSALLFSFSSILLPVYTSSEEEKFKQLLKRTFRLLFILALPISFGLSLLSRYFIITIYGYDYLPASVPLSILSFLIPCIIATDLAVTSFSARGKQKRFSIGVSIIAVFFLLLNYIFIKIFMADSDEMVIIGISIANLICWLFCLFSSILLLKKEFNVNVISFWILKPLFSCLVMSSFLFFMLKYFGDMDILKGIIVIIFGAFIYTIILLLTGGIEKEEIKGLWGILFRRDKK